MMPRDEVLRLAREAGVMVIDNDDYEYGVEFHSDICRMERFAALVAAAELGKARQFVVDQASAQSRSEIQRLTELANTAEKWRGIALARDGDGRTVQEVQEEARAEEREACAKVCESLVSEDADDEHDPWSECAESCAAHIRARGAA